MDKELPQEDQKYLPSGLLEDDDVPTASSLKHAKTTEHEVVYSAPPVFLNLSYRIEEDFFDEKGPSWAGHAFSTPQKGSLKQGQGEPTQFELQVSNTRKLSLQHEEEYLNYQSYQSVDTPFYPDPHQDILNSLPYLAQWCRDQYGSRNLQNTLETADDHLRGRIFEAISCRLGELVYDKFGNYVVQKLIEVGSGREKQSIYEMVRKDMLFISLHSYGCRVVQKIVEWAGREKQMQLEIMGQLQPHLLQIVMNQNGNHIVQRVLELFTHAATQPIAAVIAQHLHKLSFHSFGCRVIQKYLENGEEESRNWVLRGLMAIAPQLCKCQYGNYIMQYMVSCPSQCEKELFALMEDNFQELSCNKFASNVIEKAIKSNHASFNEKVVHRIIKNQDYIAIAKHQFGNYVIQSLLERAPRESRGELKTRLKENGVEISKSQYGRHVLMQMEKHK